MSYVGLLKAAYAFGVKTPTDAAQHYIGCGYDHAEKTQHALRHAAAYAELSSGKKLKFPTGWYYDSLAVHGVCMCTG